MVAPVSPVPYGRAKTKQAKDAGSVGDYCAGLEAGQRVPRLAGVTTRRTRPRRPSRHGAGARRPRGGRPRRSRSVKLIDVHRDEAVGGLASIPRPNRSA